MVTATGGIRGAVAKSAEDVYEAVPVEDRPLLRDLLLRLVAPGLEGEPVRGPVARRLLASDPQHNELIELLVGARLVTSDDGVVELAHEALARAWPRLRGWLDDDSEGQRIRRHLTGAADAWDALGRPDTGSSRGVRLRQTLEWRERATRISLWWSSISSPPQRLMLRRSDAARWRASGAAAETSQPPASRTARRRCCPPPRRNPRGPCSSTPSRPSTRGHSGGRRSSSGYAGLGRAGRRPVAPPGCSG